MKGVRPPPPDPWWKGSPGQPSPGLPHDSMIVKCGAPAVAVYHWPEDPDSGQRRLDPLHVCEEHLEVVKAWASYYGFRLLYERKRLDTGCKQLVRRRIER